MTPDSTWPAPQVAPNALRALGGIWRLAARRYATAGHWLTVAGLMVILFLISPSATPGRAAAAAEYVPWIARVYVCFIVPVLAFLLGAAAIRENLGSATADYVLTRPVRRPAFIAFRYLAHVACTQIDFLFGLAVLGGIGAFHGVPGLASALPLLLAGQVLAILAFTALGFLCGIITSRYVIVGLIYGAAIEVGLGNVPTQLNQFSMLRQLLGLLRPVLRESVGGATTTLGTPAIVAVLMAFSAAALAATALLFTLKEFTGSAGRES
jgi:ABC-2 type transport system permease protein